eukprot:CAMPEP_0204312204 /NCGR_PEP_ID=MMETSP0469-20131031/2838_1 /ASSEMBLY_ACC=CAM_ASM_000384 /TAXON_ID=2969 /ORGANISM="Oxyrrhis marina" /LENGTH=554 /DNA_ID=CAMNT_0051292311 /DNA_START=57 /DNA_END=1718 /DNA_ORIENTATION=-
MNAEKEPVVKRHTVQFYQNGDVYAGQWERTFRSGWGVLLRSNGDRYEGDWVQNCRTGLGLECLKSGQKFAGAFLSDQRCGLGVAVTATGFLHRERYDVPGRCAYRELLFEASGKGVEQICEDCFGAQKQTVVPLPESGASTPRRRLSSSLDRSTVHAVIDWSVSEVATLLGALGAPEQVVRKVFANRVDGAALDLYLRYASREGTGMVPASGKLKIAPLHPRQLLQWLGVDVAEHRTLRKVLLSFVQVLLRARQRSLKFPYSLSDLRKNFCHLQYPVGDVELTTPIGEGGYGKVFQAKWNGTVVAAKVFHGKRVKPQDGGVPVDFVSELLSLSCVQHSGITRILGVSFDPEFCLLTEFVRFQCLFDLLHKGTQFYKEPWPASRIARIARQISAAMSLLHEMDVVHCDLKSSNVLVAESWHVKLCDFGLSHFQQVSRDGHPPFGCVGTHHWMAPEVLRGEVFTKPADVYSFGMVLAEMGSREVPFKSYTPIAVTAAVGYGGKRLRPAREDRFPRPLQQVLANAWSGIRADGLNFQFTGLVSGVGNTVGTVSSMLG